MTDMQQGGVSLDNQDDLAARDPSDMIGAAQLTYQQLTYHFDVNLDSINSDTVENIVFFGMGGSALAAVIFEAWKKRGLWKPFSVVRDYNSPGWVNEKTLAVVSSYSGNTEETVSAFYEALNRNAQIVVLDHAGNLDELATKHNIPIFHLPETSQPRMAVFYGLKAIAQLVEHVKASENLVTELALAAEGLKASVVGWTKQLPTEQNIAKQLAKRLVDKNIVIMGGPLMSAAAYKWKISFNESSKHVAFYSIWPEFNHNEFLGWSNTPVNKPFAIIQLHSEFESVRMQQRYDISNELLAHSMPDPLIVDAYGETAIEQLLWAVVLGDHVSTYLALLNGIDPTPVELIEKLKTELKRVDKVSIDVVLEPENKANSEN